MGCFTAPFSNAGATPIYLGKALLDARFSVTIFYTCVSESDTWTPHKYFGTPPPSGRKSGAFFDEPLPPLRSSGPARFNGLQHRPEDFHAVSAPQARVTGPIWMRHQPKNISFAVADAGNVFDRAVRVSVENDLPFCV